MLVLLLKFMSGAYSIHKLCPGVCYTARTFIPNCIGTGRGEGSAGHLTRFRVLGYMVNSIHILLIRQRIIRPCSFLYLDLLIF